jgi:hypothetical protein
MLSSMQKKQRCCGQQQLLATWLSEARGSGIRSDAQGNQKPVELLEGDVLNSPQLLAVEAPTLPDMFAAKHKVPGLLCALVPHGPLKQPERNFGSCWFTGCWQATPVLAWRQGGVVAFQCNTCSAKHEYFVHCFRLVGCNGTYY